MATTNKVNKIVIVFSYMSSLLTCHATKIDAVELFLLQQIITAKIAEY